MRRANRNTGEPRLSGVDPQAAASIEARRCDWPDCACNGEFRAPRSPRDLNSYLWFCLDHIRQYNRSWNFYKDMQQEEVEAEIRRDTVWRRPTWRLGGTAGIDGTRGFRVTDGFGYFNEDPGEHRPPPAPEPTPEDRAMGVLELEAPVTVAMVKARYKELVKRHHPDANGGTKAAEEKFKEIDSAYRSLMESLAGA